uniref:Uncharacterized protein n=1 Tax=Zea mays TaxID=4577 RepID=B6U8I4_MAIZE|nr:hypothetical protein [Zea mays]
MFVVADARLEPSLQLHVRSYNQAYKRTSIFHSKHNRLTSKKERYSIVVSDIPSKGNGAYTGITGGVCTSSVGFPSSGIFVKNTGSDGMICVGVIG